MSGISSMTNNMTLFFNIFQPNHVVDETSAIGLVIARGC
jgi:hypothetical protein